MKSSKAKQILDSIKDPKLKKQIEGIMNDTLIKNIRCMSKVCKGRIIANVWLDKFGKESIKPTTEDCPKGKLMFMRAFRHRLDGHLGFQCWCGNDSRLCEAEKGIVSDTIDKVDILNVHARLKKNPPRYIEKNGKILIDNFLIEKI